MVRPNPRYDPVSGTVTTPTTPREPRPNPRFGIQEDIFVKIDGYSRNLALEERLQQEVDNVTNEVNLLGDFSPAHQYPLPSWWGGKIGDFYDESNYGFGFTTHQQALDYMKLSKRYHEAKINLFEYQCNNYPRDPAFCQHATQFKGILSGINSLIPIIESRLPSFQFPEILPQVFAEEEPVTTPIPEPVTTPKEPQPVTVPIPEATISITDNMITQQIDYFTIENGRAKGQITFTATQNFNPFYYNTTITNLIQFKDRNGANILPTVKQNNLRFTATERTETIRYDEGMKDNIYSKVSSFVWSSARTPTAFSKPSEFEIREKEPVKPISSGFMAAGVAGAIAGLILIGFIADHRGGK
tara:strand:+ start:811 stop:1881 length:1071 start_codon:yes stop_codon:yes gene_type:complete